LFCIAMHKQHTNLLKQVLKDKKTILSFFEKRFDISQYPDEIAMVESTDYIITDSQENLRYIQSLAKKELKNIMDISPFDTRVDFGISQQLSVQKILVPVDDMLDERFEEVIQQIGMYLPTNENARVHLFTRSAEVDRKRQLLEKTRFYLQKAGMEPGWAVEEVRGTMAENQLDNEDTVPVKFFVEQCVSELDVSKCIREQRLILDMRHNSEVYLQITGISMGIPQIVYNDTQFVEDQKNGLVLKDVNLIAEALIFYLDSMTNWNEAMVNSYELGKKYTTRVLIEKWKEVIDFVGSDSNTPVGQ